MKTQDVKLYAAQQLHRLQALPDNQRRAELAKLRRGIGHAPGELPELWGSFLLGMPESFQGRSAPSAAEWAVYLALTLYAMHQQGNDRPMTAPATRWGVRCGSWQSGTVPDRTGPRPVCSGGSTRWSPQKKSPRSATICGA